MSNTTATANTNTTANNIALEENPAVKEIQKEIQVVLDLLKKEGLDLPWVERILDDELYDIGALPPIQNIILVRS